MPILTALAVGAVAGMLLSGNESETQQESLTNIANNFTSSINNSVDNSLSVDTDVQQNIVIKLVVMGNAEDVSLSSYQNASVDVKASMAAMSSIDSTQSTAIAAQVASSLEKSLEQANTGFGIGSNTSTTSQRVVTDVSNDVQQHLSTEIRNKMAVSTSVGQSVKVDLLFMGDLKGLDGNFTQEIITKVVATQIADSVLRNMQELTSTTDVTTEMIEDVSQTNSGLDFGIIGVIIALMVLGGGGAAMAKKKGMGKGRGPSPQNIMGKSGPTTRNMDNSTIDSFIGLMDGGGSTVSIMIIVVVIIIICILLCVHCTIGWFYPEGVMNSSFIRSPLYNLPQSWFIGDEGIYDPDPAGPGGSGWALEPQPDHPSEALHAGTPNKDPMWFFGEDGAKAFTRIAMAKAQRATLQRISEDYSEEDASNILFGPCLTVESVTECGTNPPANKKALHPKLGKCFPRDPTGFKCVNADGEVVISDVSDTVYDMITCTRDGHNWKPHSSTSEDSEVLLFEEGKRNYVRCTAAMNRGGDSLNDDRTTGSPFLQGVPLEDGTRDFLAISDDKYIDFYTGNCQGADYVLPDVEDLLTEDQKQGLRDLGVSEDTINGMTLSSLSAYAGHDVPTLGGAESTCIYVSTGTEDCCCSDDCNVEETPTPTPAPAPTPAPTPAP